jgi:methylornithine synthase
MASKFDAHVHGLLIEEGLLCGIGETSEDLIYSLETMKKIRADQVRAMTFNPQPGTPMATMPHMGFHREALLIAVMRLVFPDILIPASLDVGGIEGIKHRLVAGANVITSIVPQGAGLAGVARPSLGIEDGRRTVESVVKMLTICGLEVATQKEYLDWINSRQRIVDPNTYQRVIA